MSYSKLSKTELIERIHELEQEVSTLEAIKKELDATKKREQVLQSKYDILVNARKEDKDKIAEAEKIINDNKVSQQNLIVAFKNQHQLMQKQLDEQNETIIQLFSMMDATINTQYNYYQNFKNAFLSLEPIEKKED